MAAVRISVVARRAGVSPDTIRLYERRGVVPRAERTSNGYRVYSESAVERILLVRRALAVGFTLAELARILRVRDRGGTPCRDVRAMAHAKLAGIDLQLRELRAMKKLLRRLVADWDARLAHTPAGQQARLLDALPGVSSARSRQSPIRRHSSV